MGGIGASGRKQDDNPLAAAKAASEGKVDTEAIVASVAGMSGPAGDALGGDGCGPDWTFSLNYTDQRGRVWTGEFKAHVLTTRDRMTVGLTKARLGMGVPFDLLDPTTANMLEVLAHLEVALDARPPWAGDLTTIYDQGLLAALYGEVVKHEARFHRADARKTG